MCHGSFFEELNPGMSSKAHEAAVLRRDFEPEPNLVLGFAALQSSWQLKKEPLWDLT